MWAIHRLLGVVCTINAMSSVSELRYLIKSSGSGAIFTCRSLLATTRKAAIACGIADSQIFIIEEGGLTGNSPASKESAFLTLDDLIDLGRTTPPLKKVQWDNREGERRTAFLSWSSGTSGVPVSPCYPARCWEKSSAETPLESCHAFPQECHFTDITGQHIRKSKSGRITTPSITRIAASKSYLRSYRHLSLKCLSR